jgi:hypothetical protein
MEPELEEDLPNWYEQFWASIATSGVLIYVIVILLLLVSLMVGFLILPLLEQLRQVGQ